MNEPLQEFNWKKSDYDHPEKGWICGHLCEGTPCQNGPDSKGKCHVISQCVPSKIGDRYECTRPPIHGGKCSEGPGSNGECCQSDLSCKPVRTLPAIRNLIGLLSFALAMVICLMVFSGSSPSIYVSPGHLTSAHATLDKKCSECHSAGDGGLTHWLKIAVDSSSVINDNQRCLKCHQELGPNALLAHGMGSSELNRIHDGGNLLNSNNSSSLLLKISNELSSRKNEEELNCSTCHREHHGRNADIKKMTNLQCQKCHQKQFDSFSHGHPELKDYPHKRRTRIYFDHAKHFQKYFANDEFKRTMPEGIKPESCVSCHVQDTFGNKFLTKSFEKSCASCHESQIIDKQFPGIPFIALPAVNYSAFELENDGRKECLIGEWPNQDKFSSLKELPPFMNIFLNENNKKKKPNLDNQQIYSANLENKKAIIQHVWDIKNIFHTDSYLIQNDESNSKNSRAEMLLKLKPSIVPTLRQAQKIWFPNLDKELKLHLQNKNITVNSGQINHSRSLAKQTPETGWSISFSDYTIRYRPIQHEDPLLKNWLDDTVRTISQSTKKKGSSETELKRMFRLLANPTASGSDEQKGPISSGSCLKCHTIDKNEEGEFRINWKSNTNSWDPPSLTTFSHQPHLINAQKENCASCHSFNEKGTSSPNIFRKEFFNRDKSNLNWNHQTNSNQPLSSGFREINKIKCASCHNRTQVSQSCLQCHQYHLHKKMSSE